MFTRSNFLPETTPKVKNQRIFTGDGNNKNTLFKKKTYYCKLITCTGAFQNLNYRTTNILTQNEILQKVDFFFFFVIQK